MDKFKVLDLFSGIGGFSLGLERTGGFETVAFCEIEPYCRRVLAKHWPKVKCYDDIRTLTAETLHRDGIRPDIITGGFPCQDISIAGDQKGIEAERSGLWTEYARLIGEIRPQFAIVENVPALLSGGNGEWFGKVLGDMASVGFDAEWHCIPAAYVGAPHYRDRVWILAYPKQVQCVRPILNANTGKERARGNATEWCKDGDGFEMGKESNSISYKWMDEPGPLGMVDGLSDWPYRLAALGNSVVPQIPELIGRAILDYERIPHAPPDC